MSHVSRIELVITDLGALKLACKRLGFEFLQDQKTYRWYGRLVTPDKHPLPEGLTENDLGKCDHAISVPNAEYEIGVVQRNNRYLLLLDYWDTRLKNAVGENGGRLKQAYAVERTHHEARLRNFHVSEQRTSNGVRLVLTA